MFLEEIVLKKKKKNRAIADSVLILIFNTRILVVI
jgi:hypothetical protein